MLGWVPGSPAWVKLMRICVSATKHVLHPARSRKCLWNHRVNSFHCDGVVYHLYYSLESFSLFSYYRNKQLILADSPLKTFLDSAQSLSPSERGDLLLESEDLMAAHSEAAAEGETSQVEEAAHHLISFVRVGDQIYDMDNLASKPHWVAECDDETFPAEAMKAAKSYIERRVIAGLDNTWTPHHTTPQCLICSIQILNFSSRNPTSFYLPEQIVWKAPEQL